MRDLKIVEATQWAPQRPEILIVERHQLDLHRAANSNAAASSPSWHS